MSPIEVDLRLNAQQLALVEELVAASPVASLSPLVGVAVDHDRRRAPDPLRAGRRPEGRPPTPAGPGARLDVCVEAGTGVGVPLRRGERVRIEQVADGVCADLNAFALNPPGQRFDAARTRAAHGLRVSTGAVLWSAPPERPLLEIVADTAGPHDLSFPACSAHEFEESCGQPDHSNCVAIQQETQRSWGLGPDAVHDPLNLWLPTEVLPDGRLSWRPVACRRGDHVELRAFCDVLVVVNPCGSDLFGATQWELGPIRVLVDEPGPAPREPSGPEPRSRWRDLPVHSVPVVLDDAVLTHVAAVRERGWLGGTDAEVVRALLFRWWEDAVLELGELSR